MKFITRIQSIADLITNSSSEAFVMRGDLICNFLGIEPFDSCTSSVEEWNEFVDVYIMPIIDKVEGFYVVDIEDHFADACEVTEEARSCSLASEYRH